MLTKLVTAAAAAATLASATAPALAQTRLESDRFRAAQQRYDRETEIFRQEQDRYDRARNRGGYNSRPSYDNRYNDQSYYDPSRDYRAGSQYQERVLSTDDRVYAGTDGRYYCRRSDGTTGLILGAAGGGVLGNVIDGGRSRTVGTLLGAALGAVTGRAVQQNQEQILCR